MARIVRKLRFMESECKNCGVIGKIGEDFQLITKHGFMPYQGEVLDEDVKIKCNHCGDTR